MAVFHGSLIPGNRGGKVLVVQNFRFHRHETRGEKIHWRCWRQNCRAKVYTNLLNEEDDDPVNRVMGFHRTMNDTVQVRHPSLWLFIRHLKDRQTLTEESIMLAERGDARRRRKWRILESTLARLKAQYNDGDRDIESYWSAVSHCVVEAV